MCAAVIGGMERLKRQYAVAASKQGVDLRVINGTESNIKKRLAGIDLALIFTNKVSHNAKMDAVRICKTNNIPFRLVHACGVSTLSRELADAMGQAD